MFHVKHLLLKFFMRKNKKRQESKHKGRSKDMTCQLMFTDSEVLPERNRAELMWERKLLIHLFR